MNILIGGTYASAEIVLGVCYTAAEGWAVVLLARTPLVWEVTRQQGVFV